MRVFSSNVIIIPFMLFHRFHPSCSFPFALRNKIIINNSKNNKINNNNCKSYNIKPYNSYITTNLQFSSTRTMSSTNESKPSPSSSSSSSTSKAKFQNPKFVTKQVNDYAMKYGMMKETSNLKQLRLVTANHPRGVMMGDPIEASLFQVLLPAMNAKRVIEVGVFTGYTTLVLAHAVGPNGTVLALDVNEEFTNIGKPFWEQDGVFNRIDLRIAPAVETLTKLVKEMNENKNQDNNDNEELFYDFAFIDADKVNYKKYYELLLQLIRPNGIIAIDNVLWGGKVLLNDNNEGDDTKEKNPPLDEDTKALQEITKYVFEDDRVDQVMLPFADGVTLVRKK